MSGHFIRNSLNEHLANLINFNEMTVHVQDQVYHMTFLNGTLSPSK